MKKVVLVLALMCFGFSNATEPIKKTDPKIEDLSLLPYVTLCQRMYNDHFEQVFADDSMENYYWAHQVGGVREVDDISAGYAIVKCNAWEANAKLTKSDD